MGVRGLLSRLDPVRLSKAPPTWSLRGFLCPGPNRVTGGSDSRAGRLAVVALVVFEPGAAFALAAELTWRALTQ